MCWSTGRAPMAQPPGSETLASPQRARSGPSTRIDARMVLTMSYGAVGLFNPCPLSTMPSFPSIVTSTPICPIRRSMVEMSLRCGTLENRTGSATSRLEQRIGSAAFFAPEMATSPTSGVPPSINNLSKQCTPLIGCQGLHRKGV